MRIIISGILTDFKGRIFLQQDSPTSLAPVHRHLAIGTVPADLLDQAFRQETSLIVMPVRMTGLFYDAGVSGGELTFSFRCTMRGGDLVVPDAGRPAGFFDCPPLPEGLSPKFRQQAENALHHPGGPPHLETTGGISQRLGRLFGRGKSADEGEQWRVSTRMIDEPAGHGVEFVVASLDEKSTSTPIPAGESPWAAAQRISGTGRSAVQLHRVEIDADRRMMILGFAPIDR